ncbi:unnamed protein product [Darwinula stevensoni]|uniref:Uncharacterized protein n=1 Tax=Darwinula stevensoni TaxID=69355 RepID=A0A7R9A463_9CRUS|nr:unnamed protein product [Darwinula stevensoni]CAG0889335.1 unnamed protein product [Darwinula stevensoni]
MLGKCVLLFLLLCPVLGEREELRCDCEEQSVVEEGSVSSICSARATSRGLKQQVVSYSLYGSKSRDGRAPVEFEDLVPEVCEDVKVQYPGWVMRIYTDYKPEVPEQREWMCEIQCNNPHVDFCLVDRLPELGDVTSVQNQGRTWRFLPGMDPLVDIFLSRDTDSLVIDRERDAVREWLESDSMVHAMRDHPRHGRHILAGMWGAKTFMNRSLMASLTAKMLFETHLDHEKEFDQDILREVLWPATKNQMMVHDSYFCSEPEFEGPAYRPFPTRRDAKFFVSYGPRFLPALKDVTKCPLQCRPREHRYWVYC